jgi:hypothetical protein
MSNTAVQPALDAPNVSLNDFRAMREGRAGRSRETTIRSSAGAFAGGC